MTVVGWLARAVSYVKHEVFGGPKRPWIVFNSFRNRTFNFNAKYLFLYMRELGYECYFIIDDAREREALTSRYGQGFISSWSMEGARKIFLARTWITSAGMPVRIPFAGRSRTIVNLWHGVPLKKVGYDDRRASIARKLTIRLIYRNNYTYICATSAEIAGLLSRSLLCSEAVGRVWGQPQNDIQRGLYPLNLLKDRERGLSLLSGRKNLLYAPTYREYGPTRLFPFHDFDGGRLSRYLRSRDIKLFIRMHGLDATTNPGFEPAGPVIELGSDRMPDIMEILDGFDLLITDYSSLYIDYLLLSRPIIFLPYDKTRYENDRGLYFDYDGLTPGPKPGSQDELIREIDRLLADPEYYAEDRNVVANRFHEFKGSSCKEIAHCLGAKIARTHGAAGQ